MKKQLGAVSLVYPIPMVLVGADVEGRANFATVGDCCVVGLRPALVAISLGETHHTTRGVEERRAFSLNFPSRDLLSLTDYCGMVSGRDVDKEALFPVIRGELGVPMIESCPVTIECRVAESVAIAHRRLFVAEVVQTHIDEDLISYKEGKAVLPDLCRLDPIIYALDNRYYAIGKSIGVGYHEGKQHVEDAG